MDIEKFGFDMGEDSEVVSNIDSKGKSRDFFSFGKGFGQEKTISLEFFDNQNFLQSQRKSLENSNGKLDLQFNIDIGSCSSNSSEKFRPISFDTFKNSEEPFKKLEISFDIEKSKENFKNPEPSIKNSKEINVDTDRSSNLFTNKSISKNTQSKLEKIENSAAEKSNFESARNFQNKPEQIENSITEQSNFKKKIESLTSFQNKLQKTQNIVTEKQTITRPTESLHNKSEPAQKNLYTKPEVTKIGCQENVENFNKPFEYNKQVELKKCESKNPKTDEMENKIISKRQFLNKADPESFKRKNNLSPIPYSRVRFFSSANKSLRLTPAIRNESVGISLRKEEFNFEENLSKIEELQKKIESVPMVGYDKVIDNECDILKFEEQLPKAILGLVRLKWMQLQCINSLLSEADPDFKEIIMNYIELDKVLNDSN